MGKMQKVKKGFTLVELSIVIAVIAILIAVLVPTFISLINSAQESNDMSTVKNLNTFLQLDETTSGKSATTLSEALEVADENGYNVSNLTPMSSGNIIWDQVNNRFILVNKDNEVVYADSSTGISEGDVITPNYTYWSIIDSESEYETYNTGYSLYINTELASVASKGGVEYAEGITSTETSVETESVTNTASTEAKALASLAIKTAGSSNSNIPQVIVKTNGGSLTADVSGGATVNHLGMVDNGIDLKGETKYLKNASVTGDYTIESLSVDIIPVEGDTETITIVIIVKADKTELQNYIEKLESYEYANISVASNIEETATALKEVTSSIIEVVKEVIDTSKFAGGAGTEQSPYLIATATQFANINELNFKTNSYYFKQTADITVTSMISQFAGCYDGGDCELSVSNTYYMIYEITGHSIVKNLTVDMNGIAYSLFRYVDWKTSYGVDVDNITFNSNTLIEVNSNNYGLVVCNSLYTYNGTSAEYNFKNITNNANIQNEGTCTGFIVGSGPCFNIPTVVNYENCVNNATITGSQNVGFLYGNAAYIQTVAIGEINVTKCINNGTLRSIQTKGTAAIAPGLDTNDATKALYADKCAEWQEAAGGVFRASNFFDESNNGFNGVYQSGTSFAVSATSTGITYKLVLSVQAIYVMPDGSAWNSDYSSDPASYQKNGTVDVYNSIRYFASLTTDNSITGTLNKFYAYDVATAIEKELISDKNDVTFTNGFAIIVKDGTNYMIINKDSSYYINSNVTAYVYAYDANGNLIGMKTL